MKFRHSRGFYRIGYLAGLVLVSNVAWASAQIERLPVHKDTVIVRGNDVSVVILVPDSREYRDLGQQLATAIEKRTGVKIKVEEASGYVAERPRLVAENRLDRNFILLGQFWNNAVLERLYNRFFDPIDAFFPGPGGYELRTISGPFKNGHNCIVASGSDLEGCRRAVARLPEVIKNKEGVFSFPFLREVRLAGEAAQMEADYRKIIAPYLKDLDRYIVYNHPQAKSWVGIFDPRYKTTFTSHNLAMAGVFGLRYWVNGDPEDGQVFRRIVLACIENLPILEAGYREGQHDIMDYAGPQFTIAWDLIEESDIFSESDRQRITDYLFRLGNLSSKAYYIVHCKDKPLNEIVLGGRHAVAGTFWLGLTADYFARNCRLTSKQKTLTDEWHANARRFLQRLSGSYLYSDVPVFIRDEMQIVTRYSMMVGEMEIVDNGTLRSLADYWVANNNNLQQSSQGSEMLNLAGWLFPGEGYQWFRSNLCGRWSYSEFFFYTMTYSIGVPMPFYHWELPAKDDGSARLKERMTGIFVTPIPDALHEYTRNHPQARAVGGVSGMGYRYPEESVPPSRSWKTITFRSGFEKQDQFLLLDGLQGLNGNDDLNAVLQYDELGQQFLTPKLNKQVLESRLDLNSVFVSHGRPEATQSTMATLETAVDLGPHGLVRSQAKQHDGVQWTRNIFWQKEGWFLFADEIRPLEDDTYFVAQSWISGNKFTINEASGWAEVGDVRFTVLGTKDRLLEPLHENQGLRQTLTAKISPNSPRLLWSLIYGSSSGSPKLWHLRQLRPNAVLLVGPSVKEAKDDLTLAFLGELDFGGVKIKADIGLLTANRMTLAGCREIIVSGQKIFSADEGRNIGWNFVRNSFESGKRGFGLMQAAELSISEQIRTVVELGIAKMFSAAAGEPEWKTDGRGASESVEHFSLISKVDRFTLTPPVRLAAADLEGNGNDELLLYREDGSFRFPGLSELRCDPVGIAFDGSRKRDVALAFKQAVIIYRRDGTVRWRQELTNPHLDVMGAGDLDGDGREELGLNLLNWAMALNHDGQRLIDVDASGYQGTGVAIADVDGDGENELVTVGSGGLNISGVGKKRYTLSGSVFAWLPCRIWLRDLDGDGIAECYIGGGGTELACYAANTKAGKGGLRWKFSGNIRPRDVTLGNIRGDDKPELISGGEDGFLYVVDYTGKFCFSQPINHSITSLASVTVEGNKSDIIVAGLASGDVILLGRDLAPIGKVRVGNNAVNQLAVLQRVGKTPIIIAADDFGQAVRLELPIAAKVR